MELCSPVLRGIIEIMQDIEDILQRAHQSALTKDDIPQLHSILNEANAAYAGGKPVIEDSIYDYLRGVLENLDPSDPLVKDTWEQSVGDSSDSFKDAIAEWGDLLNEHPMYSIKTVKSLDDQYYKDFIQRITDLAQGNSVDLHLSYKINGHGIRVVYKDGNLVSATSRARGGHGDDILPLISNVMPTHIDNPEMSGRVVEIRGELCLPLSNLPAARQYNSGIKSPLSAVTSLKAADPANQKLLKVLTYGYYDEHKDFPTKKAEYEFLRGLGLDTPEEMYLTIDANSTYEQIDSLIGQAFVVFEDNYDAFGYFCDGVVCSLDSTELFREQPIDGSFSLGNMALKVGLWRQTGYVGKIVDFHWIPGKTVLNPVADVVDVTTGEPGVLVAEGFRVRNIPLYNPSVIYNLGLDIGGYLHFNFGGESGVVPTYENGELVTSSKN